MTYNIAQNKYSVTDAVLKHVFFVGHDCCRKALCRSGYVIIISLWLLLRECLLFHGGSSQTDGRCTISKLAAPLQTETSAVHCDSAFNISAALQSAGEGFFLFFCYIQFFILRTSRSSNIFLLADSQTGKRLLKIHRETKYENGVFCPSCSNHLADLVSFILLTYEYPHNIY